MASETGNALAHASSSYLRSARHQPIRWHEWSDEAFAIAQRENKLVLLDIGAVWCHWCHVMDRESYENPEVAALINKHFVAVKVDRDERPEVDSRYQTAVQAISGQGGWPLTVFLTPDGRPFFGGTYFPPEEQMGRPGFKRVLQTIAQAYVEKHGDVMESADSVMAFISQAEAFNASAGNIRPDIADRVIEAAKSMFDPENGGFGAAPKFPHPSVIDLIIHKYAVSGDADLRNIVVTTLERMAKGGVYDQLGGGFHRYSIDEHWTVPHFEKMSYDNSELLKNYVHGFQATGVQFFAEVARDIVRWMDEVLSNRDHGGFYASQDADISLDDDGDYFTWTVKETHEALADDEFMVASLYYDIGETGEMHHNHSKNVLFVSLTENEIAKRLGLEKERVRELLTAAKSKLFTERRRRPAPYVDQTIYTGWNSLCISAYLEAARVLSLKGARQFALRSLDRILSEGWKADRGLAHVIAYSESQPSTRHVPGLLDDYAFTALACLDAYEVTADLTYYQFAERIAQSMLERFSDSEMGGFFDLENQSTESKEKAIGALSARRKPFQDAPTPAGNSAAAIALLRLFDYTNDPPYREHARRTLELLAGTAEQYGMFAATYAIATLRFTQPHTQVVIVGNDAAAARLFAEAEAPFSLTKSVLCMADSEASPRYLPPAFRETIPNLAAVQQGKSVAVICSDFTCQPPITDSDEFAARIREIIRSEQRETSVNRP